MPLVKINMLAGKTPEFKKTVFDCIHEGLIDAFGIAGWDRFQRIEEFDKSSWEAPEGKTENFMIIELTIFPGRTHEQKKCVIEKITGLLFEKLEIPATDVFIVMNEPSLENWGMGGNLKC
ncbi:MAG: tautomerase family protein [Spirochaetaceae bacterium]|nr:tautomerase family protein [Spirochaetaceae bacterium]